MVLNIKFKNFSNHFLDALQARIAKFEQLVAVHTNQMVMLAITEGPLVFGLIFSKLMSYQQLTLH